MEDEEREWTMKMARNKRERHVFVLTISSLFNFVVESVRERTS